MRNSHTPLPSDPSAQRDWARDFEDRYGMPPIAGGETQPGEAPPPAEPAPSEPPPQGATATAPAPGETPAADAPPWAQELSTRMDEITQRIPAPPAPTNPLSDFGQPQEPQVPGQLAQPGQDPQAPAQPGQPQDQPLDAEAQAIENFLRQTAGEEARKLVEPYIQQQELSRRAQERDELFEDYPDLRSPEEGQAVLQSVQQVATDLQIPPHLASEPRFVELVHLARKGRAALESETPATGAQPGEVHLETPSPSQPGGAPEKTPQERIKDAGGGFPWPS